MSDPWKEDGEHLLAGYQQLSFSVPQCLPGAPKPHIIFHKLAYFNACLEALISILLIDHWLL